MAQDLSRRDFLKLSGLALGILTFNKFIPADQEGKETHQDFLGVEKAEGASIFSTDKEKGGGIIQTGLKSVEINGQAFGVEVDGSILREMILLEAGLHGDAALVEKTTSWLGKNDLEVEIYKYEYSPILYIAGGCFVSPEFHGGRAKIGIPDNQLKKFYEIKENPQIIAQNAQSEAEEINPVIIIPHEVDHLLQYVKSPYAYLAKTAARIGEVFVAGWASFKEKKKSDYQGSSSKEKQFAGLLRFASVMFLFNVWNIILGLDKHSGSVHTENEELLKQINNNQRFKDLALGVVKFTPA